MLKLPRNAIHKAFLEYNILLMPTSFICILMKIILERDKILMMSPIGFTYEVGLELPPLLKQNIIQLRKYVYSDHPLITDVAR